MVGPRHVSNRRLDRDTCPMLGRVQSDGRMRVRRHPTLNIRSDGRIRTRVIKDDRRCVGELLGGDPECTFVFT